LPLSGRGSEIKSRRAMLRQSLVYGGMLVSGFHKLMWPQGKGGFDSGRQGVRGGLLPFTNEGTVPMNEPVGAELDGRLFTDLSSLTAEGGAIPTKDFYIRTRASALLDASKPWAIQLTGLVEKPVAISAEQLRKMARPMGRHLMECAGNYRDVHFGMISVADWHGILFLDVLKMATPSSQGYRVMVSGFDQYAAKSQTSVPGASWIFSLEQLKMQGAFLATEMNGEPLAADHGFPARLVVPGWYGCACIKWVNEIELVNEDAPGTSQMQEYAARTMQSGVPRLAKEYLPARIDCAAMPIRVEKWLVNGKTEFHVVGIQWGDARGVEGLEIQFNPEEKYFPVANFAIANNGWWNLWSHRWIPQKPGSYSIRLRAKGTNVASRRLESGYYVRSVETLEI
jgi:DMSO/TMAO reductase YedYZ molybdopterin-dependent catalytic subunit